MPDALPTVLFAGGGTGGHLFPAIAIAEQLRDRESAPTLHFACSNRQIDTHILSVDHWPFTPFSVTGLPAKVTGWPRFIWRYSHSRMSARRLLKRLNVKCVVAMGGFVSGPVVTAAKSRKIPVILVNLDAVPGKANRFLAGRCDQIFTVYPVDDFGRNGVTEISLPIRQVAVGPVDRQKARQEMGFDPAKPLMLITGASQGAQSINQMMTELAGRQQFVELFKDWQILHLAGNGNTAEVEQAYLSRHMEATVLPFTDRMGLAWSSADLAVSRGGAGSVAEVIANQTPTIFIPYPYHKDNHQGQNAKPLVEAGGAVVMEDIIEPSDNADQLLSILSELVPDSERLTSMQQALKTLNRGNSAQLLAKEVLKQMGSS